MHAGRFSWPLTLVRDIGWYGDVGVTLFVIASGFGLTYGLLAKREARLDLAAFYRRRAFRILPLWWAAHVLFLPLGLLRNGSLSTGDWHFYADLLGLRFLPGMFYYFSPAWWYVGLILQLYLVFPLLWTILRRYGPAVLLAGGCAVGFLALALGPVLFHNAYLDEWQRGAFFVTRLPEFVAGMSLAYIWFARPALVATRLRMPAAWLDGAVAYAAGTALSFTLPGMIVAPFLLGTGAFIVMFALVARGEREGALGWVGRKSYSLYLTHHPFVLALVPASLAIGRVAAGVIAALGATVVSALILERVTAWTERALARLRARRGTAAAAGAVAAGLVLLVAIPVCADLAVTAFDPQEVNGWGERSSLEPDARFGWNLIPSRTTRLRWESYDYRVTANALGFRAPEFPTAKPAHALRILVTGDAYSSAEGVDTDQSWPRLLQADLEQNDSHRPVQVLDFAITGYGPNEKAAVVDAFAPRFHPDLVLIETFAKDVADVFTSDDRFRASIGFGQPPPTGFTAVFGLAQLRAWLHLRVVEPLVSIVKHRPAAEGFFLGNFIYVERGHAEFDGPALTAIAARYAETARTVRASGGELVLVSVPPPIAVCSPQALRYYPRYVDLSDRTRYDLDLPDQRAERIAALAHLTLWDLRPDLRALPLCPYMPRNMHWTADGQRAVAAMLAQRIEALR